MSERDGGGLSRLDADRAHSMEDEGGASAARVERQGPVEEAGRIAGAAMACLVGVLAGVGLVSLMRSR
jgi:hypothetical protein